ncbi:hypothetical protein ECIG_00368 [Escherichia coli M605]|uniref:Uncharacterized protein n=1 Tax=Escherichia coli M605 TaxID=656417 RepID=F4SV42_ECOLX|nr:hypothetical protein ECIG_00368 [Escherichia coli M605]
MHAVLLIGGVDQVPLRLIFVICFDVVDMTGYVWMTTFIKKAIIRYLNFAISGAFE